MNKPSVGQHVRVVTRYRNTYIYDSAEFTYHTYIGVVHKPEPWCKEHQFKLVDDKIGRMSSRTLDMNHIVRIEEL